MLKKRTKISINYTEITLSVNRLSLHFNKLNVEHRACNNAVILYLSKPRIFTKFSIGNTP